jgi:hypothetical protein
LRVGDGFVEHVMAVKKFLPLHLIAVLVRYFPQIVALAPARPTSCSQLFELRLPSSYPSPDLRELGITSEPAWMGASARTESPSFSKTCWVPSNAIGPPIRPVFAVIPARFPNTSPVCRRKPIGNCSP